eukprot:gene15218-20502_t
MDAYEVLETLGTGSYGTVSKLRRKADKKILVWKEINFGKMSEREKNQLVAEVNILRDLRNPFIVRYHDRIVDKPNTRLYIIMEYCAGGDLGKIIKRSKQQKTFVDENLIWKIFSQSILALKDCHRRSENGELRPILHRDIKPANILLDSNQNIKMGDFGLAKELSSQSKLAQTNVGTPFYMAPEIVNEKDYDEKSDIWSLGCLLYELASLKPPFDANNAVSLALKINKGTFPRIPTKYSESLFDLIRNMLQVDPKKRPKIEELEQILSNQPAMLQAKSVFSEYKLQQSYSIKFRELKAKEDTLLKFEATLNEREKDLKIRSDNLQQEIESFQQYKNQCNGNNGVILNPQKLISNPYAGNSVVSSNLSYRYSLDSQTDLMVIDEDNTNDLASIDYMINNNNNTNGNFDSFIKSVDINNTNNSNNNTVGLSYGLEYNKAARFHIRKGPVPVPTTKTNFEIHHDVNNLKPDNNNWRDINSNNNKNQIPIGTMAIAPLSSLIHQEKNPSLHNNHPTRPSTSHNNRTNHTLDIKTDFTSGININHNKYNNNMMNNGNGVGLSKMPQRRGITIRTGTENAKENVLNTFTGNQLESAVLLKPSKPSSALPTEQYKRDRGNNQFNNYNNNLIIPPPPLPVNNNENDIIKDENVMEVFGSPWKKQRQH